MFTSENDKAVRDLPKLLKWTGSLVEFTDKLLAEPIRYSEDDHLAFMGLLSVSQQLQFLKSIRLLVENNLGVSAGLIARAMLESMCSFLWCGLVPKSRPLGWRAYAYVKDFRLMRQKEARGEIVPKTKKTEICRGLQKYGNHLLTRTARDAQQEGHALPQDPYVKQWPSITVEQMFQQVQATSLYEHIYRDLSELTHGSVAAFGASIRRGHHSVEYSAAFSPALSATALAVGFQSLLHSLELLDTHLRLWKGQEIVNLKQLYIKTLQAY